MAKYYTGFGDRGRTMLKDGVSVWKDSPRVEALGTLDEANSTIGLARSFNQDSDVDEVLQSIQEGIFKVGSILASAEGGGANLGDEDLKKIEAYIDVFAEKIPPPKGFVIPAGSPAVASLHLARAVVRRAERRIVSIARRRSIYDIIPYMNRLSSLLYVLARVVASRRGEAEWIWRA